MIKLLQSLKSLGFSRQETQIYLKLLEKGPQSAKELAKHFDIFPQAVYRSARKLVKLGLIGVVKSYPQTFQAYPPSLGLPAVATTQIEALETLTSEFRNRGEEKTTPSSPTKINLLFGKEKIFDLAAKLLSQTTQEMLVVSIGEEITPNLLLAVVKARQRRVVIKMIAHKFDAENKAILENLKKNGYKIRHFPDWGFHLAVYDAAKSLIIVNNPQDTSERVAMQIESLGLSKALRDYFYTVWQKARPV